MQTAEILPQFSFILVSDGGTPNVPDGLAGRLVVATDNCIVIGCRSVDDGPTKVTLARMNSYVATGLPVFSGHLMTVSKTLVVSSFPYSPIFSDSVENVETTVHIFVNDRAEPDFVEVLFD
jgi:hypothetical protein